MTLAQHLPAGQTDAFSNFKASLEVDLGADVYRSFFESMSIESWSDGHVVLALSHTFAARLVTERFGARIYRLWEQACGPVASLKFAGAADFVKSDLPTGRRSGTKPVRPLVDQELSDQRDNSDPKDGFAGAHNNEGTAVSRSRTGASGRLSLGSGMLQQTKTLDCFCVNETNRLARHAAVRMLDGVGSPITYVYGSSGRGKTHLLNAAALEWMRRHPNGRLTYLHYDVLVADVSDAFVTNGVKDLKEHLQDTDMLVFDDVHLLRGRKRTQEELACLIDKLQQTGKPALVAGALPPQELAETGISQRLADRLAGGLSVEVQTPDRELRLRVAGQWAEAFAQTTGYQVPQRHLELIARRCDASIRELEGVMCRFELEMDAANGVLTDDQVQKMISQVLASRAPDPSVDDLFRFTVDLFGIAASDMSSRSRKQHVVRARQAFCMAARRRTDAPLSAIGSIIHRDHTTVMHSIKKAEIIAETDPAFADKITQILEAFEAP